MKKITIYLDNCCWNRPYDDQGNLTVSLETQAKIAIQELVNNRNIHLAWSFILDFENSANPDETIKREIHLWRNKANFFIKNRTSIVAKAKKFAQFGIKKKDA